MVSKTRGALAALFEIVWEQVVACSGGLPLHADLTDAQRSKLLRQSTTIAGIRAAAIFPGDSAGASLKPVRRVERDLEVRDIFPGDSAGASLKP